MMFLQYKMLPASFRGVKFYYRADAEDHSKNVSINEVLNSDEDTVFVLGSKTKQFTVDAVIKGNNYTKLKQDFIDALSSPDIGVLMHPFYGELICYCLSYKKEEDIKRLGGCFFSIVFKIAPTSDYPSFAAADSNSLFKKFMDALDAAQAFLADEYDAIDDALALQHAMENKLRLLELEAKSIFSFLGSFGEQGAVGDAASSLTKFNLFRSKMIFSSTALAENITNVNKSIFNMNPYAASNYTAAKSLFPYGDDDKNLKNNSFSNVAIIKNKKVINGAIKVSAFAAMASFAAARVYKTQDEVQAVINELIYYYKQLFISDFLFLDLAMYSTVEDIKVDTFYVLTQAQASLPRVVDITVKKQPLLFLVYSYYGSLELYETILRLNNITNPSIVCGKIKMIEKNE